MGLDILPFDVMMRILDELSYRDLIALSQVNKRLNSVANDNFLWRTKLLKDIHNWKRIDSRTYPGHFIKTLTKKKSVDAANEEDTVDPIDCVDSEMRSSKQVYLSCCPDIITQKEILRNLQVCKQFERSVGKEWVSANTSATAHGLSLTFFNQFKDYLYKSVFESASSTPASSSTSASTPTDSGLSKIVMFGPGLETSTSCLVTNMLWKSEFKTLDMIPGKDGYGSGILLQLFDHKPFNLTTLYTNVSKVRQNRQANHAPNANRLLCFAKDRDADGELIYELEPKVKDACTNASGFVYVVDNNELSKRLDNGTNYQLELSVFMREVNPDVPLLVLACTTSTSQSAAAAAAPESSPPPLSCYDLIDELKLDKLKCEWLVRKCSIESNRMKDVTTSFEWLLTKLNYKNLLAQRLVQN